MITFICPTIRNDLMFQKSFESLFNQTDFDKIEIIIINANKARSIKFRSNPHNVHVFDSDLKPSEAINKALDMASGDLICWSYDDDINLPDKARIFQMYADKYKDIDIFYSDHISINKAGLITFYYRAPDFNIDLFRKFGNFVSTMACCVRRDKIRNLRFNPTFDIIDEYIYFMEAYRAGCKFMKVEAPTAFIRFWAGCRSQVYFEKKIKEQEMARGYFGDNKIYTERVYENFNIKSV